MTALRRLLPLVLVVLLAACAGGTDTAVDPTAPAGTETTAPGATASPAEPDPAAVTPALDAAVHFLGPDGDHVSFDVEVVADQPSRQLGLMHRTELAEGTGMLFVFPGDSAGGFWMKNTLIPLQIAYIDADGGIVDIMEMTPCEADPCPSYTPEGPYRYALEVNSGALDAAGIDGSWTVDLPDDLPDAT